MADTDLLSVLPLHCFLKAYLSNVSRTCSLCVPETFEQWDITAHWGKQNISHDMFRWFHRSVWRNSISISSLLQRVLSPKSGVSQCKCWNSILLLCSITNNGIIFLHVLIRYKFTLWWCYFYLIWWPFWGAITSWCFKLCLVPSFSLDFFFSGRGFKSLGGYKSFSSFSGET